MYGQLPWAPTGDGLAALPPLLPRVPVGCSHCRPPLLSKTPGAAAFVVVLRGGCGCGAALVVGRLGAGDEGEFCRASGAALSGERAAVFVHHAGDDAFGFFSSSGSLGSAFMMSIQTRDRAGAAGEFGDFVLVVADPDDGEEVAGKSGEPAVAVAVCRAGFACDVEAGADFFL